MPFLRQSTAQTVRFGPFLDKTDGLTEETALTLAQADMRLSKDGGAFAQKNTTGNATHDSDGWYSTSLDTTDTATVGELIMNVHQPANTLPVWMRWWVIEEAVYDAMYGAAAEGPLQGTTAGNKIDVNATGEAGLDLDNTSGTIAAAQLAADCITAAKVAADVHAEAADAVWDEILTGATHNIATSAGRRLREIEAATVVDVGTAQAGGASTITLAATASATNDIYRGDRVIITAGTGVSEHGIITTYNGTTKVATMAEAWVITPDATSEYEVSPSTVDIETWQHEIVTASASVPDVNVQTIDAAAITAAAIATDAIGAAEFATDAVNEIRDAILSDSTAFQGADLAAILTDTGTTIPGALTALQASTDDIQTRLPAGLVSGAMDADVSAMQAGVVTAAAVATDAIDADALATDAVNEIRDAILPVKNIALPDIPVFMVLTSDHVTGSTGLTLGVTRSIDGGAFGAGTGTATEISVGMYQYDASAADMNGALIVFRFTGASSDDTFVVVRTTG